MRASKEKRLPNTVYIKRENPGTDDEFLSTGETIHELSTEDKETIGVYRLEKTVKAQLVAEVTGN